VSLAAGSPIRRPFPPERRIAALAEEGRRLTRRGNLNPVRYRSFPRVVKRARHNSYRVKKPGDVGARHHAAPQIDLPNLKAAPTPSNPANLQLAA
jgi:hypothetical protein